jgi:CRP/FNR family cyclic AMP-dependent transcriptional regulator
MTLPGHGAAAEAGRRGAALEAARPSPADMLVFMRQVPLFAGLDERALQRLAAASRVRAVRAGELLFSQGEPGEAVYVVQAGRIAIVLATPDGREMVINQMRPGDFFGELALLPGQTHTANAAAREASRVLCIHNAAFLAELEAQPRFMRYLLDTLAGRLRASSERESALAFLTAPARLARLLLQQVQPDDPSGPLVAVSQDELAQEIGVTRQTVAKVLGGWRRAGWIITGRGRIMLVNQAALRRLASDMSPS